MAQPPSKKSSGGLVFLALAAILFPATSICFFALKKQNISRGIILADVPPATTESLLTITGIPFF